MFISVCTNKTSSTLQIINKDTQIYNPLRLMTDAVKYIMTNFYEKLNTFSYFLL